MKKYVFIATALVAVACGKENDYDASGVFEATEVIVSARGNGEIMRLDVAEGQAVTASEAVGLIDTIQLHLRQRQLSASMQNVSTQTASLVQQISTNRRERARIENLLQSNAATKKQLDDIEAVIAVAERQLAAQRDMVGNTNRSLAAQLEQLDDQIVKNIIVSPIDGVVLAKYAERGELAAQGRALFKVADLSKMHLRVYITADQLTQLKLGQQVRVFADWDKDERREYPGSVSWISDKAEFTPKTIQTRDERTNLVYAVKIAVENDGYIKSGMYGEIKIETQSAE